ncbi:hypothetical protein [Bradyrhizobium barranii]
MADFFADFLVDFFLVALLTAFFFAAALATVVATFLTDLGMRLAAAFFALSATVFTAVSASTPAALAARSVIWSMIGFCSEEFLA